jgi:hypothetical protein
MKLLFVRSNKLGSRIIRWGLGEPVSHVAVDIPAGIYHSYGTGIIKSSRDAFHAVYTVHRSLEISFPETLQQAATELFESYVSPHDGYDYPALAFFAFRAMLKKLLRVPFPKTNRLQVIESFLCTEIVYLVAQVHAELVGDALLLEVGDDLAMHSPWELYQILEKRLGTHAKNNISMDND